MNEEKKIPIYLGARLPWSKRRLVDGSTIYKVYALFHGPCLIIDNRWDTVIRLKMPSFKALRLAFKANVSTSEELIKFVFKSQRGACVTPYLKEEFELGDLVWILFKDYTELTSKQLEMIDDGIKDYDNEVVYPLSDILLIQKRIPYDLVDDEGFIKFLGR